MKILYISRAYLSDSDFPLIRALLNQDVNIDTYIFGGKSPAGILDLKIRKYRYGIWRASCYPELVRMYGSYIDLNRIHLISIPSGSKGIILRYLVLSYLFVKFLIAGYDLIHFTWPLLRIDERMFYRLPYKKLLTVHDPIPHSSQEWQEKDRKYAFKYCEDFVLLSSTLKNDFSVKYVIDPSHIYISRMGEFDYLSYVSENQNPLKYRYILFFGQIAPHKGLDVLLNAMIEVHKQIPDLKLVIAGRGKMYFDFEKYSKLDYIVTKFRYINIQEMVYLFKNSEFVVCPYKDATQSGVVQTAFSLNAPVLATNVGALSSMIENEITGKIIPPNDDRILANSIVNLATKPNIIKDMKKNIELIWRPQMKWATIAKEYISIYEHLLK